MSNKNVGVFVDIITQHRQIKFHYQSKLDYAKYLEAAAQEGNIFRATAYGAQLEDEASNFIKYLQNIGFEANYITARKLKTSISDIIYDIIALCDISPKDGLIQELKELPKRELHPDIYRTDRTMEMVVDICSIYEKLDTIIIGSSNLALIPFIQFLKGRGKKVIIFSCSIPVAFRYVASSCKEINKNMLEERYYEDDLVDANAKTT